MPKLKTSNITFLSGQKLIKNAKMVNFGEFLKTWENAKIEKFKCDILCDFQTLCKGYWSSLNWCRYARDSQELKQNYFEDLLDDPEDRIFGAFVLGKYEDGKTFRSVRSDIKLKCRKIWKKIQNSSISWMKREFNIAKAQEMKKYVDWKNTDFLKFFSFVNETRILRFILVIECR